MPAEIQQIQMQFTNTSTSGHLLSTLAMAGTWTWLRLISPALTEVSRLRLAPLFLLGLGLLPPRRDGRGLVREGSSAASRKNIWLDRSADSSASPHSSGQPTAGRNAEPAGSTLPAGATDQADGCSVWTVQPGGQSTQFRIAPGKGDHAPARIQQATRLTARVLAQKLRRLSRQSRQPVRWPLR